MWYTLKEYTCTDGYDVSAVVSVDAESPLFDGHFPDDPVLPAIGQLSMVADILGRITGNPGAVSQLRRVKFRRRIKPGEQLTITAQAQENTLFAFRINTAQKQLVCSGFMAIHHKSRAGE